MQGLSKKSELSEIASSEAWQPGDYRIRLVMYDMLGFSVSAEVRLAAGA